MQEHTGKKKEKYMREYTGRKKEGDDTPDQFMAEVVTGDSTTHSAASGKKAATILQMPASHLRYWSFC